MSLKINTLDIVSKNIDCEIEGKAYSCQITEFLIDGQDLSALLGIHRDLGSSGCDLDKTETRKAIKSRMVSWLSGESKPFNQFETNRVVLYRCHCGCDYCGVISCEVIVAGDQIEWRNIRFEGDEEVSNENCLYPIKVLAFRKSEYLDTIRRFCA